MFETKSQVPCSAMRVKTAYPPKKKGYAAAVSLLPLAPCTVDARNRGGQTLPVRIGTDNQKE